MPRIEIPKFRVKVQYGSHMPVLINTLMKTTGPVIELGGGIYSTFFLHWVCRHQKRELLTCESNEKYYQSLLPFSSDLHSFILVDDWIKVDLSRQWSVAFVDQKPPLSRAETLKRLTHVDYVVVHDTESRNYPKYGYSDDIINLYKNRCQYRRAYPYTSILSNKYDVSWIMK